MNKLSAIFTAIGLTVTEEQMAELTKVLVLKDDKPSKSGKVYYFRSAAFEPKTPLQMRQLVLGLSDLGSATVDVWATNAAGYLETRQDPAKIIAFYRKRMLDEGLITLDPSEKYCEQEDQEDQEEEQQEEEQF